MPDADWPDNAPQRAVILADFDPASPYGDRRQEIVFIGAGMDRGAIESQLDSALLSDAGARAAWRGAGGGPGGGVGEGGRDVRALGCRWGRRGVVLLMGGRDPRAGR